MQSLISKIEKKDLVYWIIILGLIIVAVVTRFWGSSEELVTKIGFGGTIASLILAVIAIIYSFIQGHDTNTINQNINKSIESLANATVKIDVSTKKLEVVEDIANKFDDSIKTLDILESNLNKMTQEICTNTTNNFDKLRNLFQDEKPKSVKSNVSQEDRLNIATILCDSMSLFNISFLYYSLRKYEIDGEIKTLEFVEILFEDTDRNLINMLVGNCLAILTLVDRQQLLIYKTTDADAMFCKLEMYSDELKGIVLERINAENKKLIDDYFSNIKPS